MNLTAGGKSKGKDGPGIISIQGNTLDFGRGI